MQRVPLIPAPAGIQSDLDADENVWVPAFAGKSGRCRRNARKIAGPICWAGAQYSPLTPTQSAGGYENET